MEFMTFQKYNNLHKVSHIIQISWFSEEMEWKPDQSLIQTTIKKTITLTLI